MKDILIQSVLGLSFLALASGNDLCIQFQNIKKCSSSSSVWAINTPDLVVKHDLVPSRSLPFILTYELDVRGSSPITLCSYEYISSGCLFFVGQRCTKCINNITSDRSVFTEFSVGTLDGSRNTSKITYKYTTGQAILLHQLDLAECPKSVGDATATINNTQQCGYNCSSNFTCSSGTLSPATTYQCNAAAAWSPQNPTCLAETTTTDATPAMTSLGTLPDSMTTEMPAGSTSSTKPGDVHFFTNSGPILAGIGGVLAAVCIALIVYMAINNTPNNVVLYVMSALCICVWAIALGLCFGLSTNKSAVIAGIVLGSLADAGMVVVIVFLILHMKSHKREGIPGKPEKSDDCL